MFTVIGLIILVLVIYNFFASKFSSNFSVKLPLYISIVIGIIGFILTAVFYANPGHSYKVYFPVGGKSKIVNSP